MSGVDTVSPSVKICGLRKSLTKPRRLRQIVLRPFRWEFLEILKGIDLEVGPGEILGLVGPNGAGKTTLIRVLCGLLMPTDGTVTVCGYDVVRETDEVVKRIGYVPASEQSFIGRLTGYQNLEFFARLYGFCGSDVSKCVGDALEKVNLTESASLRFTDYSSGMKQRLCIARALLGSPQVLLLDEPTRSLDPVTAASVRYLIKALAENHRCSVILSSHNLTEVESLCHRIALIHKGRLAATGSVSEVVDLVARSDDRRLIVVANTTLSVVHSIMDRVDGILNWSQSSNGSDKQMRVEIVIEPHAVTSKILRNLIEAGLEVESSAELTPSLENALVKIACIDN